jgi:branched-subunit amino acid transport protein
MNTWSTLSLWSILILLGLATLLPRSSFIILGDKATLPEWLKRILRYAPASALAAMISPDIFIVQHHLQPFNAKCLAAIGVVIVVSVARNPWFPFIVGMSILMLMRHFNLY